MPVVPEEKAAFSRETQGGRLPGEKMYAILIRTESTGKVAQVQ